MSDVGRKALNGHKASGGDAVEVEAIAEYVATHGLAAVVLGLKVALQYRLRGVAARPG